MVQFKRYILALMWPIKFTFRTENDFRRKRRVSVFGHKYVDFSDIVSLLKIMKVSYYKLNIMVINWIQEKA